MKKCAAILFVFLLGIQNAFGESQYQGDLWRIEGHGGAAFILGESHANTEDDSDWTFNALRALIPKVNHVFLEMGDINDTFPFRKANCTDGMSWVGLLQRQIEQLELKLSNIKSLRGYASTTYKEFSIGSLNSSVPTSMVDWNGPFGRLNLTKYSTSRISQSYEMLRMLGRGDILKYLDSTSNNIKMLCELSHLQREKALMENFKNLAWQAHIIQESNEMNAAHARQALEAMKVNSATVRKCAARMLPCHISTISTKFALPSVNLEITEPKLGEENIGVKITRRNSYWAATIDNHIQKNGELSVIVVGSMHLPSYFDGKKIHKGLLDDLQDRGYKISPVINLIDAISEADISAVTLDSLKFQR
jgi:uncharacterized protein YbaP (TraB family)